MTDQYIGIDLHKAFFQACAVTPTGDRLWEGRFPRTPAGVTALTARCTRQTCAGGRSEYADVALCGRGSCRRSATCGSSIR